MIGSRRCQDLLHSLVQLAGWSWLALLIPLYSPAEGHSLSPASALDSTPRAALVTLARENDLEPLLSSMSQLEDSFNNRYKYDWVFFGVETLSDKFRQLTSNATAATCIYEVALQNDVEPRWFNNVCHSQADSTKTSIQEPSTTRGDLSEPLQSIRQIQRWNNGPFAKEKRLQTYDWFWRIEPGFTHDVKFDVFRFMRDHNIAYGSNRASLGPTHLTSLSQDVKRFLEKHPDLLHAEAELSWLLESSDIHQREELNSRDFLKRSYLAPASSDCDWPVVFGSRAVIDEIASAPAEAFTSWLRTFGALSDVPKFEIGSLGFFRSYSHQVLLEHFDELSSQHDEGLRDMLVPSISASIFLPQKSVWNFRQKDRSLPHPPDSTPEPQPKLWHLKRNSVRNDARLKPIRYRSSLRNDFDALKEHFAVWDAIVEEFDRQEAIPGLRSGNTVIDERNFALGR
ncbi:hypothetical protein E4U21_007692 [Claviceps maximensis]|nr:hypothetical protein E4U21_007692 [Claviceps maximensis]